MNPHGIDSTGRDDAFNSRALRLRDRILDGIEETLAELAQPPALRAALAREMRAQRAWPCATPVVTPPRSVCGAEGNIAPAAAGIIRAPS